MAPTENDAGTLSPSEPNTSSEHTVAGKSYRQDLTDCIGSISPSLLTEHLKTNASRYGRPSLSSAPYLRTRDALHIVVAGNERDS